jgi:MoaA/NifB/PqqE/SkfB family radical SAM enzyme
MNHPTDVSIITTYRCRMRCKMCSIIRDECRKLFRKTNHQLINI